MRGALILVITTGLGVGMLAPALKTVPPPGPDATPRQDASAATPLATPGSSMMNAAPAPGLAPNATTAPAPVPIEGAAIAGGALTTLAQGEGGHYFTMAEVNGTPVRFVVDTGASTVALTIADAQRAGIVVDPTAFAVIGSGASGDVRGQTVTLDSVSLDGKRVESVRAAVLEGLTVSLLGQSYLSRLGKVEIAGGVMTLR